MSFPMAPNPEVHRRLIARARRDRVSEKALNIAIFHLGFFYSGGGEKLVLEEIRGLRDLGHEVTCFAPYIDWEGCYPGMPEMARVKHLLPPPPPWVPARDSIWIALSCLLIPLLAWRFRSYDVFLGANQPGLWFAWVLAKVLHKPYVVYLSQPLRILHPRRIDLENGLSIRDREADARFLGLLTRIAGWFIDWADRASVRDAAVLLSDGDHVSQWLRKVYGREDIVCPAGCHPVSERELKYSNRWEGRLLVNGDVIHKPYILLSNRHAPHKRFEYALWAMKQIRRDEKSISLVITGQETSYTDQLRYLVDGLRLKENVRFVGLVTENELARLYGEAALYVYPSPEEDFGMGIIEAMGSGTPVVAWNNGGPTGTVINGETGYLIEPYDTEDLARKILRLSSDPALAERMGRAGHRRACDVFSFERHNRLVEESLIAAVREYAFPAGSAEVGARSELPAVGGKPRETYSLLEPDDVAN